MRALPILAPILAMALTGCSPPPPRAAKPAPDPTTEAWYAETTTQLAAMSRDADAALARNEADRAGDIVTKGQPLIHRLLSAAHPTLAAMEAVSDLDQIYGRMLLANRHYEWARGLFQKNATRWKLWTPQTAETARRLKLAHDGIAECERHIGQ